MKHVGERIKAALELDRVPQCALAIEMDTDAGYISRTLSQADVDGWTGYLIGRYHERFVNRKQVRQEVRR